MADILLRGERLSRIFEQGNRKNQILNEVDIEVYQNDFTVIMGSSGAGKSTLLYTLSGMDRNNTGRVFYHDFEITGLKEKQMAKIRAEEFGFIFQQMNLISNLTLMENILVAGYVGKKHTAIEVKEYAGRLVRQMNLENACDRLPSQVSGGEAQRAAIARAIISDPGIVFADEPTGALNRSNSVEVLNLLTELNRQRQSIVMVTHDLRAAVRGNRILYMEDGKILDEYKLPFYSELDEKERENEINLWFTGLRW